VSQQYNLKITVFLGKYTNGKLASCMEDSKKREQRISYYSQLKKNDCSLIKRKTSMILKEYALRLHHLSSSCPSNQGGSQDQISVIINVLFLNDSAFIVLQIKGWYRH